MPGNDKNTPIPSFTPTAALSERRLRDTAQPEPPRKPRVVVTGGSGNLGRWVVREMVEHGWDVVNCGWRVASRLRRGAAAKKF